MEVSIDTHPPVDVTPTSTETPSGGFPRGSFQVLQEYRPSVVTRTPVAPPVPTDAPRLDTPQTPTHRPTSRPPVRNAGETPVERRWVWGSPVVTPPRRQTR